MHPLGLSCWADAELESQSAAEPFPARVDVVIVGAGFTGLSAALHLVKRGRSVAVLEAHHIGWGASSRNAGMVLTGLKLGPQELVRKFGVNTAAQMDAASIEAIDFVERIVKEEAIECNFVRSGHLALASKPSHFAAFSQDAEVVTHRFNRNVRLITKDELSEEIGSERFHGALLDEVSASLHPAKYVTGLARAAQRAGATIHEQSRVTKVETSNRGSQQFDVITTRGHLSAGNVILTTGAYTGNEFPGLYRRVVPIGSYIIATEVLPPSLAAKVIPRNRMLFDSNHFLHYFRLTPDNRLLFGGRASFVPESERTTTESSKILRKAMISVFPGLRDIGTDYVWGGTIDFTFDMLPHAGRLDGMYYAAGYAGHGVALATYLGAEVARAVADESPSSVFVQKRIPSAPLHLYSGRPWFLPFAGAWLKFIDWVS